MPKACANTSPTQGIGTFVSTPNVNTRAGARKWKIWEICESKEEEEEEKHETRNVKYPGRIPVQANPGWPLTGVPHS
jgi:hypothetical protein